MSKLPDIAGNLKCWRQLNTLAFGGSVTCPVCELALQENYTQGYLYKRLEV